MYVPKNHKSIYKMAKLKINTYLRSVDQLLLIFQEVGMFFYKNSFPGESICPRDFKDTAASRFGHSDVVFCLLLVANIKRYRLSIISRNA